MALPLLNLDDRRWTDLVDEAMTLIPVHAPSWTDHNIHDPGITLMELFAWIAEMDMYRANQVPDRHRLAFLAMAATVPRLPRGATTVVGFQLRPTAAALLLPVGTELVSSAAEPDAEIRFRTEEEVTVIPGYVAAVQSGQGAELEDLTPRHRRGEPLDAFGPDPQPGASFFLGLSEPVPVGGAATFQFVVDGGDSEERRRIGEQEEEVSRVCGPPDPIDCCEPAKDTEPDVPGSIPNAPGAPVDSPETQRLEHHSVWLAWEQLVAPGVWRPLDPASGEVEDRTRALTLNGSVTLRPVQPTAAQGLGDLPEPLHYVRARLVGGAYDAPPRVRWLQLNAVPVRQETAARTVWTLEAGATVSGPAPSSGDRTGLRFTVDANGGINAVEFGDLGPSFHVLSYHAPTSEVEGMLELEAALLGVGSERPGQVFQLPRARVAGASLRIFSLEDGDWREWARQSTWTRSRPVDAHYLVDPDRGEVALGDGHKGRTLPRHAFLVAVYDQTAGAAGNLPPGSVAALASDSHNRARVPSFDEAHARLEGIVQRLAAHGGENGEIVADAAARTLEELTHGERAATLEDIEALAIATPGTRIARASAKAAVHPAFPCIRAPGVVTVVIVPFLPASRPDPSPGLLSRVASYLAPRRVLGTRIEVAAPEYVSVTVRARVRASDLVDRVALAGRLRERIDDFFHPLRGGPDGDGWPFGRDVYRSEVMQILDETEGTDHVLFLEFLDAFGTAVCGNLCLPACGLVAGGAHEIEVTT